MIPIRIISSEMSVFTEKCYKCKESFSVGDFIYKKYKNSTSVKIIFYHEYCHKMMY